MIPLFPTQPLALASGLLFGPVEVDFQAYDACPHAKSYSPESSTRRSNAATCSLIVVILAQATLCCAIHFTWYWTPVGSWLHNTPAHWLQHTVGDVALRNNVRCRHAGGQQSHQILNLITGICIYFEGYCVLWLQGAACTIFAATLAASIAFTVAQGIGRKIAERIIDGEVGGESSGEKGNAAQQALARVQASVEKGGFWQQYSAVLALRMTPVVPFRYRPRDRSCCTPASFICLPLQSLG